MVRWSNHSGGQWGGKMLILSPFSILVMEVVLISRDLL